VPFTPGEPWRPEDVVGVVALMTIGLALSVAGWVAAARQATLYAQSAPIALGISGLVVTAFAMSYWLMLGRRAVGLRRVQLTPQVLALARDLASTADLPPAGRVLTHARVPERIAQTVAVGDLVLATPTMRFYHRSGCVFSKDKPGLDAMSVAEACSRELSACPACHS
jgi:hypothetical protein